MMPLETNHSGDIQGLDGACWNRIGVQGDRTCPRLSEVVHCRNCPVFAEAGERLFERHAPPQYLEEWTARLSAKEDQADGQTAPLLVFRLGNEWLALDVRWLMEVVEPRRIHRVPHRTNRLFLGLTNVRGELQLCVSLRELLGIQPCAADRDLAPRCGGVSAQRLVVAQCEPYRWVFPVDQIDGVHRMPIGGMSRLPHTVERSAQHYSEAVFSLDGRRVGLLSKDRLLEALEGVAR